jgi:hypothetical protein
MMLNVKYKKHICIYMTLKSTFLPKIRRDGISLSQTSKFLAFKITLCVMKYHFKSIFSSYFNCLKLYFSQILTVRLILQIVALKVVFHGMFL